jgi:ribosomal protein L34E
VTRELIYEDEFIRRYEVRDPDGNVVGYDEESKQPPDPACPTCGRPY